MLSQWVIHIPFVNRREKGYEDRMTLSDIQRLLGELDTHPTRSLGQNFLHDQNLARSIVALLDIQPGDHIVEIGPGLGALTEFLDIPETRLTLIEKDSRLIPHLRSKFEHGTNSVFHADALDFDLRELWGHGPVKVIGNLPYYISVIRSQPILQSTTLPLDSLPNISVIQLKPLRNTTLNFCQRESLSMW